MDDILDDQYVVCITDFSSNIVFQSSIINKITFILIKTLHCQIGHLRYNNLLQIPKIADAIQLKDLILAKIERDYINWR